MLPRRRWRGLCTGIAALAVAVAATLGGQTASAASHSFSDSHDSASAQSGGTDPSRIANPDRVLAPGWRSSTDRAVTTVGDVNGLHVLAADASSGYAWRTAATLAEPGFDTSQWIGQACVTGSGRDALVVYAPRQFANNDAAFDSGSYAAVVDLTTGAVRKLPMLVSLAYYDPGCGAGSNAALSSLVYIQGKPVTVIDVVDVTTGKVTFHTAAAGEITSAVPFAGAVIGALGSKLLTIDGKGAETVLSASAGVPFRLHPDAQGGLAYQVPVGRKTEIRRWSSGKSTLLGTGGLGAVQVAGSGGHVFLTGPDTSKIQLDDAAGKSWQLLGGPVDSEPSTTGAVVVTNSTTQGAPGLGQVIVRATVTSTKAQLSFTLTPVAQQPAQGLAASPALGSGSPSARPAAARVAGISSMTMTSAQMSSVPASVNPATVSWDPDRGCSVPRNDPAAQTYQASAKQIEWAADLAVQGQLNPSRGVNWQDSGMPVSWTPQGLFPLHQLTGGGSVPAQVLLGVLAQESNTLQASPHAVDAVEGNFNQGGFYGDGSSWSTVDCGYGVGQVTTGMAVADGNTVYTANQQRAIATDYASNIAAALNILIDKWNQLKAAGIIANNGDPQYIENWYLAVWAFNSGVQPGSAAYGNTTGCTPGPACTDNGGAGGNWGLGWFNNPANPRLPSDRAMFNNSAADTKVPSHWSYPELVMGWASSPVPRFDYSNQTWAAAYTAGTWPIGAAAAQPPFNTFCSTSADQCTPNGAQDSNGTMAAGLCLATGSHCWWHAPVNWTNCSSMCGKQVLVYTASSAKPLASDVYPPDGCTATGLPTGAVIVDDVATLGVACSGTPQWTSRGQFSLNFPASTPSGCTSACITYQGKIDFHQIGTGYGGHTWFTHMDNSASVTATWTPPSTVVGWTRIKIHIPDSGATTQQADYQINLGGGQSRHRLVNQQWWKNTWVDLGAFNLASGASVSLSNSNSHAPSGDGGDVAFDAVAFIPSPQPVVSYVALGDSYSSGEGLEPYETDSDLPSDACHRSNQSYAYGVTMPGHASSIATEAANNGAANFAFLACSGAETINLTASAVDPTNSENTDWGKAHSYDKGELYQIDDTGYLDQGTTLVTLSIGGNDARFADILAGCIRTITDCTAPQYKLTRGDGVIDPAPLVQYEPYVIGLERTHLEAVYTAIHSRAPNAKIIVLGYPKLFQDNPAVCQALLPVDQAWMNQMSGALNQSISAAIGVVKQNDPTINIKFVDPTTVFLGHSICDSVPWINGIIAHSSSGSGTSVPGTGSFHPTAPGHAAEVGVVDAGLS